MGLLIPATWIVLLVAERLFPARPWPAVRGWGLLGFAMLALLMVVGVGLPLVIPESVLALRLVDGTGLGVVGGAVVGYVVYQAFAYAYHRACHQTSFLWRWSHQLHHSARRMDIPGAVVFHPFEMVAYTVLQTFVWTIVLGLDPRAAALAGYIGAFYGMFQHMNVRTPTWLGYVIQRPEAHSLHHAVGVHHYNFGDLPIFDLIFGTWRNPAHFVDEVGFEDGGSARLGAMLIGQDVTAGRGKTGDAWMAATAK
jgi:sterol desaturase/sphingolipid hydroxylase (fatty acid hydroxylase superfamily)